MKTQTTSTTVNWYALRSKSRAEKKVAERLAERGMDVYLPLVTTLKVWSDRKKKVQTPLIPSFVFIKTDPVSLFENLNVSGVSGVLRFLGKPAIIRNQEIENLKILINGGENVTVEENLSIKKGEEVEVIRGPFAGLLAQAIAIKGKYRLLVNVTSLGATFSVNVPISFVKKRLSA